jgi:predicted  nucleic acid-binding Zn-ribbon protein
MAKMLEALLQLQSVERELSTVRGRLRSRKNAVLAQQAKLDQLATNHTTLHERYLGRRKDGDRASLDLKTREEQVAKLRMSLNAAKTNKEYAAVLTQINTLKADNAKLEEEALRILQDADVIKAQADQVAQQLEAEKARLGGVQRTSAEEVTRLTAMLEELKAKRAVAAQSVPPPALAIFDRIAANYDGDAMAAIEFQGVKPPYEFVCGGCYMSLTAEHVNALRTKDEIRTCDNCGRILYLPTEQAGLEPQADGAATQ